MKQTKKYTGACEILTYPHNTQEELYRELNRLGFYWHADKKKWERDDTPAKTSPYIGAVVPPKPINETKITGHGRKNFFPND